MNDWLILLLFVSSHSEMLVEHYSEKGEQVFVCIVHAHDNFRCLQIQMTISISFQIPSGNKMIRARSITL